MIGIVTPYKIMNYGTKLQAYAMQELMNKYDEAELLGFVPSSDYRIKSILGKIWLKTTKKKEQFYPKEYIDRIEKRKKAISSFDIYYRFGKRIKGNSSLKKELKKYTAVVCGSDQLWAPSNVIADWFTLSIIPKSITKFSYAASFGINEIPSILRGRYTRFLNHLDYISVREHQGSKIVKDLTGRNVSVVLDPTLMIDRTEWEKIAQNSKIQIHKPYIFCYFLGSSYEHRQFAKDLAQYTGYELVNIPHFKGWNEADVDFGHHQLYEISPVDFLKLISNADYICTDSFHGTVFSILFQRQFVVFERFNRTATNSTNSRVYTLIDSLGLKERLCGECKDVQVFAKQHIKYSEVSEKFDELRRKSFDYLDTVNGLKRK